MSEWRAKPGDGVIYSVHRSHSRIGRADVHDVRYVLGVVRSAYRDGRVKSIDRLGGGLAVREVGPGTVTFGLPQLRTMPEAKRAAIVAEFGRPWKSGEDQPDARRSLDEWRQALKGYL